MRLRLVLTALTFLYATSHAQEDPKIDTAAPSRRILTQDGLPTDENSFPIAVWLQAPRHAKRYQSAGINLYVGLWQGPTLGQLAELEKAGMPVICAQNRAVGGDCDHRDPCRAAAAHLGKGEGSRAALHGPQQHQ